MLSVDESVRLTQKRNLDVLIIVPFRNREAHLKVFLKHMHVYLKDLQYEILIVNQDDHKPFNRAWLTNVGLKYNQHNATCIVQHDVDRVPKPFVNYASCSKPTQLNSENRQWGWGLPYERYTGGVISMTPIHWEQINGMSNEFEGYGGEDDDLYHRLRLNGLLFEKLINRPRKGNGKYYELDMAEHTPRVRIPYAQDRMKKILKEMSKNDTERWKLDGLRQVQYKITSKFKNNKVTRVSVTHLANTENIYKVIYTHNVVTCNTANKTRVFYFGKDKSLSNKHCVHLGCNHRNQTQCYYERLQFEEIESEVAFDDENFIKVINLL